MGIKKKYIPIVGKIAIAPNNIPETPPLAPMAEYYD
jgi:hypothetical protein